MRGTGNNVLQLTQHLAAVADAERKSVAAFEERRERVAQRIALQDRGSPAASRPQHIAVAEAAAGGEALEFLQLHATADQVAHMHIEGVEAGPIEGRGHFDLTVDALLA